MNPSDIAAADAQRMPPATNAIPHARAAALLLRNSRTHLPTHLPCPACLPSTCLPP